MEKSQGRRFSSFFDGNVKYYDTAFPLNADLRKEINDVVLDAYAEKLNELQNNAANRDASHQSEENDNESEDDYSNEMY